jgi:hypothetical protein
VWQGKGLMSIENAGAANPWPDLGGPNWLTLYLPYRQMRVRSNHLPKPLLAQTESN